LITLRSLTLRARNVLSGLRARLLALVLVTVIPALGLTLYAGLERRHADAEHAKAEAPAAGQAGRAARAPGR
jgi:hypothetical protein